jgi:hypothetical protein
MVGFKNVVYGIGLLKCAGVKKCLGEEPTSIGLKYV